MYRGYRTSEQIDAEVAQLRRGLEKLGPQFGAAVCGMCAGRGQYEQTYTAGCGGGYYRSMGDCDECKGYGLVVGRKDAPRSVYDQVMRAGALEAVDA